MRDRRQGERRQVPRGGESWSATVTDESLFDAMGVGLDSDVRDGAAGNAPRARVAPTWGQSSLPADSRFLSRQARRIVSAGGSTFERLYRIFIGARVVLGLALLLAQFVGNVLGVRAPLAVTVCVLYAAQALTL